MLPAAEAERITGYHDGGISPFGQKKRVRVYRAIGADVSAGVLQWRSARAAGRAGAGRSGPQCYRRCAARALLRSTLAIPCHPRSAGVAVRRGDGQQARTPCRIPPNTNAGNRTVPRVHCAGADAARLRSLRDVGADLGACPWIAMTLPGRIGSAGGVDLLALS